ncbi:DUF7224 domain-containing protein [Streptomyces sp. 8L]|uniref:DUF7224 domain-containing protein n=1 Tax=Streptomyces sp. 8L TaxID=2877242 RepID=UPI001CD257B0|nr:hypothetical protein [Streptomyces sp. 8L]MCA1223624.1 hypothetical protein [Streptomyces sp. 8L]
MISLANLRASATPWLFLPALLYMSAIISGAVFGGFSDYGVTSGEQAALGVTVIAPAVAGAAAWEAGRQRRSGPLAAVSVRGRVHRFLWATTPVIVLQILLVIGALIIARTQNGAWPDGRGLLAIAHLLILPWGWAVVGWALGKVCPRAVAAPLAAVACWAFIAIPQSISSPAWRHLGGLLTESSTLTDLLDPRVYLIPWVVVAGFALAALLLTGVRRRPWLLAVSAILAVGVVFVGRSFVLGWGFDPLTDPRTGHTVCTGISPSICLPSEYSNQADQMRQAVLPRLQALHTVGLPSPRALEMTSPDLPLRSSTWPLQWSPDMSSEKLDYALAQSAVAGIATLHGVHDCGQPSIADTWAMLVMGVDEEQAHATLTDQGWAQLQQIRALSASKQSAWFTQAIRSQRFCTPETS